MIPLRLLFASALCAMVAACDSPRSELEPHDLAVSAQQLESIAGEGRWLAAHLREGDVTAGMAWVHQRALGQDTVKVSGDLTKPAPPKLRAQQEQLGVIAAQLQVRLMRIASAADRPDDLDALAREFDSAAHALHPLAEAAK